MTLDFGRRSDDGPCPDVPADPDDWDASSFADVLTDDPHWCLPLHELPLPCADEIGSILDADPEHLTTTGAIDFLIELQRAQSGLAALEARALVAVAGAYRRERLVKVADPLARDDRALAIHDEVREEVAAALHRSPGAMHDQLVTARLLAGPLSATRAALAEGRITAQHARVIADQARRLGSAHVSCHQPPDDDSPAETIERADFMRACTRLQERVLPTAERSTPARTRARAWAVVASIDAQAQEKRRQQAKASIDVHIYPGEDGLAVLFARMPILHAVRAHAAIDALARSRHGECDATLGQLRVEALVDALCNEPGSHTALVTTEVQVVVDASVVFGTSDEPGSVLVGNDGPQPVGAQVVRELLDDPDLPATIRRLITDPVSGHLLDRGRRSYRVTDAMRSFLGVRDATCRYPGCSRPASRCQIDHARAWDDGGRTDRQNLGPLCTRHHQLKTHAGWTVMCSRAHGSVVWRSPQGRIYEVDPPPVLVARTRPEPSRPITANTTAPPGSNDPPF
jgi:hypothetical protein